MRGWFLRALQERARSAQSDAKADRGRLDQESARLRSQLYRLLNPRLIKEINAETFRRTKLEIEDARRQTRLRLDVSDRGHAEEADIAVKVFELSQALREKWVAADAPAKRRLIEVVCLNCTLGGEALRPAMRKPFDVLAEGHLAKDGRGNWRKFEPSAEIIVPILSVFDGPTLPLAATAERLLRLCA